MKMSEYTRSKINSLSTTYIDIANALEYGTSLKGQSKDKINTDFKQVSNNVWTCWLFSLDRKNIWHI